MIGPTLRGTLAVAQFEGRISMGPGRWALWLVLTGFPITIVALIKALAGDPSPADETVAWALLIYVLTQLTAVLGVLLWASPALQVELENRTWIFTASRPYGRRCLILGRYIVAVVWSFSAAGTAVVVCCLIASPEKMLSMMATLLVLTALCCLAFAALYTLLAVMFPKRAMAVAFGFTLVFELLIAFVPAMINQFTIQFRLRCLLVRWLDLEQHLARVPLLFSDRSTLHHLSLLAVYVTALLLISVVILEQKEIAQADD